MVRYRAEGWLEHFPSLRSCAYRASRGQTWSQMSSVSSTHSISFPSIEASGLLDMVLSLPVQCFNQRSALCCSCLQPYNHATSKKRNRSMHDNKRRDRVCDNSFSYNGDINLSKLQRRYCARFVDTSRSAIAMVHAPNSTEVLVKLCCPGDSL